MFNNKYYVWLLLLYPIIISGKEDTPIKILLNGTFPSPISIPREDVGKTTLQIA